jgi:hypothetical protein
MMRGFDNDSSGYWEANGFAGVPLVNDKGFR